MLIKKLGIKNIKDLIDYIYYRIYYGIRKAGFKDAEIPAVGYTSLIVSFFIYVIINELAKLIDMDFFKHKSIRLWYGGITVILGMIYFLGNSRYTKIEKKYHHIDEKIKKKADVWIIIFFILFWIFLIYYAITS